jgi:hypothetical protein
MKTITLVDLNGQPLHSRLVSNSVFAAVTHAKVSGDRIVAVYGCSAKMPLDRSRVVCVNAGVIRKV